jgi:hypothetical protein
MPRYRGYADDWFVEDKPVETLHDLYTRRLFAWGYLTRDGRCEWERSSLERLHEVTLMHYLVPIQKQLNEELIFDLGRKQYGDDWRRNPEGPA